ncbi:Similar to hypothetical protein [Tuber melanosporum Mel28]; acc. no. XP_002836778 [Pyronema omphalodes CBS 100304]|uniref:Uncharacterized protein n=1 Tax=Pyronema omphalodes (strain CBS 100304) TaxID=1076935 RepID=U4LH22_PYROM|nr:Similar to hypothetical protein [Tuber melanosporum Mel28]; acc. no. XP_002836778 [Pyronema omphalodes CBS 100304]
MYNSHTRVVQLTPHSIDLFQRHMKGIYAGFIMVEAKDCEADARQHQAVLETDTNIPTRNGEQWQALIAFHRYLLHEHHEFFLGQQ